MSNTIIEKHKITLSLRTLITIILAVATLVSSYFIASERTNESIRGTNRRIDNLSRVLEAQQDLIITNRYKDSSERALIELQIEYLKKELFKK